MKNKFIKIRVVSDKDKEGKVAVDVSWIDYDGVYRLEEKDGIPVGYKRSQIRRCILEDYILDCVKNGYHVLLVKRENNYVKGNDKNLYLIEEDILIKEYYLSTKEYMHWKNI
jgi:hypothetical protein